MENIKDLISDFEEGISKINSLDESQSLLVHNIYVGLFDRYSRLKRDNFVNELYFTQYQSFIEIQINSLKSDLNGLIANKKLYTSENFYQIKIDLQSMLVYLKNDFIR